MKHGNPLNLFANFGRVISFDCFIDSCKRKKWALRLVDRNFFKTESARVHVVYYVGTLG